MVANKCDLDQNYQIVDHEQAKQLAKRLDVPFYECSCKNNLNIQNLFFDLCHRIHDQLEQNVSISKNFSFLISITSFNILFLFVLFSNE